MNSACEMFLLYSYFSITKDDTEEEIIKKCAQRAYLDLARTLNFKSKYKGDNNKDKR